MTSNSEKKAEILTDETERNPKKHIAVQKSDVLYFFSNSDKKLLCLVPKTCEELKQLGVSKSGMYLIDPDGHGVGELPFTAECDMSGMTGKWLAILLEM